MSVVPGEGAGQKPAVVQRGQGSAWHQLEMELARGGDLCDRHRPGRRARHRHRQLRRLAPVRARRRRPPPDSPVAESVAPGSTDLQALRQDFGPWRQLADGPTDSPALLLLENGAAYASERWTVPSGATWWAQDLGGNVTSVTRSGDHASIEDADGIGYTVGVNQAFIISSNPDTVLLMTPSGIVMSMPLAQATAVRRPLGR